MDHNIIALQETLAHQAEEIARMSDELYTQQKELATLRQQMARIQLKLEVIVAVQGPQPFNADDKPPHY